MRKFRCPEPFAGRLFFAQFFLATLLRASFLLILLFPPEVSTLLLFTFSFRGILESNMKLYNDPLRFQLDYFECPGQLSQDLQFSNKECPCSCPGYFSPRDKAIFLTFRKLSGFFRMALGSFHQAYV